MFTHIIFDLDETLYPRTAGLMQQINARITRYLVERMGLSPEEARTRQADYFQRYGTSLRGLMIEATIDAEHYLAFVHDIDVHRYISPNPELATMLGRIPLSKVVFTNATAEHALRVLRALGVAEQFSDIIDIRDLDYVSKPDPAAYRRILDRIGAQAEACILVEDNPRNLRPARALGMTTILVDHAECDQIDFCVPEVLQVGAVVEGLVRGG